MPGTKRRTGGRVDRQTSTIFFPLDDPRYGPFQVDFIPTDFLGQQFADLLGSSLLFVIKKESFDCLLTQLETLKVFFLFQTLL